MHFFLLWRELLDLALHEIPHFQLIKSPAELHHGQVPQPTANHASMCHTLLRYDTDSINSVCTASICKDPEKLRPFSIHLQHLNDVGSPVNSSA